MTMQIPEALFPVSGTKPVTTNGGVTCENPPGFREGPAGKLYLAYLRDPDGNKICGLFRPAK